MNKEEILKSNILIAKFEEAVINVRELNFHKSWNDLIPVFDKFCIEAEAESKLSRQNISFCLNFIHGVWNNNQIKERITAIGQTERFKNNVAEYESFQIRRKELGVSDRILDKINIGGYELLYRNLKTGVVCSFNNKHGIYSISRQIVKAIDNGELDIKQIWFSISLDMINLMN